MKKILLFFAVLFTITASAQIPTSDILASYSFTNRNTTTDDVNLAPLTLTGNDLFYTRERFDAATSGIPNTANAIQLNGDFLTRTDVNANQLTYSFWIRTDSISTNEKTIIDDSNRTTPGFGVNQYGNYVYLQNGKIGIRGRVSYNIPNQSPEQKLISSLSTTIVADGFWHHIVAIIYNQGNVKKINTELWVDGVKEDNDAIENSLANTTINRNITLRDNFNTTGNVVIGNNRNEDFVAINRFSEGFDDFLIYSRQLPSADITQIGTDRGFCYPLANSAFTINNINSNSAVLNQNITIGSIGGQGQTVKVDFAYHKASESFDNATILRNVGRNTTLSNLETNEEYLVYIRKECAIGSGIYNSFSEANSFETFGNLYVNTSASGTNDGKTWANAFTDLQDALAVVRKGQSIFIAGGIYKPTTTNTRSIAFNITKSFVSIYGGFAGYETNINQRIIGENETILSGDLSGNDSGNTAFSTFTYGENSNRILKLSNNVESIIIDGLTIKGAYNPGTVGGAIVLGIDNDFFVMNQCIIENNLALGGAGFLRLYNSANQTNSSLAQEITIKNSIFRNNVATYASGIYFANIANRVGTFSKFTVKNCLFDSNKTEDNGNAKGFLGSSMWVRNLVRDVDYVSNIYNNTFVNNEDKATTFASTENATLSLSINTASGASHRVNFENNILWNNKTVGNATAQSLGKGLENIAALLTIKNAIAEDDFSNIAASKKTDVSDADPLFTDLTNSDFTLTSASPAINTGFNNSDVNIANAEDLAGNFRKIGANVDLGAYEFGSTPVNPTRTLTIIANNGTVTTNPAPQNNIFANGTTVTLTATADSGFAFADWTGDETGNTQTLTVLMDADKTITANFSTTASIDEANKIDFMVYPNPSKDFISISINQEIKNGTIYNLLGHKVQVFKGKKVSINTLAKGIYLVKIETESGKIGMKKIIKK